MTPKNAAELLEVLPIVRAFAEGKPIQFRGLGGRAPTEWRDIHYPTFSGYYEYREKPPKPLEVRVWVREDTGEATHIAFTSPVGERGLGREVVKLFREVTE